MSLLQITGLRGGYAAADEIVKGADLKVEAGEIARNGRRNRPPVGDPLDAALHVRGASDEVADEIRRHRRTRAVSMRCDVRLCLVARGGAISLAERAPHAGENRFAHRLIVRKGRRHRTTCAGGRTHRAAARPR